MFIFISTGKGCQQAVSFGVFGFVFLSVGNTAVLYFGSIMTVSRPLS